MFKSQRAAGLGASGPADSGPEPGEALAVVLQTLMRHGKKKSPTTVGGKDGLRLDGAAKRVVVQKS